MNNPEPIGERKYVSEVKAAGGVWVLMDSNRVYMLHNEGWNSLPVWSSRMDAENFSESAGQKYLSPVFVPLENLINSWLQKDSMNIAEVCASPHYGFASLVYSSEEYIETFKTRNQV